MSHPEQTISQQTSLELIRLAVSMSNHTSLSVAIREVLKHYKETCQALDKTQ